MILCAKRNESGSKKVSCLKRGGPQWGLSSAVKGPQNQPSKKAKLFSTVYCEKCRFILTVKKFQSVSNLTISADLHAILNSGS